MFERVILDWIQKWTNVMHVKLTNAKRFPNPTKDLLNLFFILFSKIFIILPTNLAAKTAPHSSNRGNVTVFNGATLDLEQIKRHEATLLAYKTMNEFQFFLIM